MLRRSFSNPHMLKSTTERSLLDGSVSEGIMPDATRLGTLPNCAGIVIPAILKRAFMLVAFRHRQPDPLAHVVEALGTSDATLKDRACRLVLLVKVRRYRFQLESGAR